MFIGQTNVKEIMETRADVRVAIGDDYSAGRRRCQSVACSYA